jgi:uncharacterized protein
MAATDQYFPGVQIVEKSFQAGTAADVTVAAFGAFIGRSDEGPTGPTEVRSWAEFRSRYGANYTDLHLALNDFFNTGGRRAYVVRIAGANAIAASLKVLDSTVVTPTGSETPLFTATAANPGVWGNRLRMVTTIRDQTSKRFDVSLFRLPLNVSTFDETKRNSEYLVDQWLDVSLDPSDTRYLYAVANSPSSTGSNFVTFSGQSYVAGSGSTPLPGAAGGFAFTAGTDGIYTTPYDATTAYSGATAALVDVPGPYVLNMPGMNTAAIIKAAIQDAATRTDVFVVVDTASGLAPSGAVTFAQTDLGLGTLGVNAPSYAAVYYPWIYMPAVGAAVNGRTVLRPPGGAVVGAMMAADASRGVWKAPAGTVEGRLSGAVAAERKLTDGDLTLLNNANINAIYPVPGSGMTIMGARTLKKFGLDMYVNVRRSIIDIAEALKRLTRFAVFENNDERLWERVGAVCASYLGQFWQSGGLKGSSAADAFFVRCDASNNSPGSQAQGVVNIEVGVALSAPAEFIVITIGQFEGSSAATASV